MIQLVLNGRRSEDPNEILTWLQEPIPPEMREIHVHLVDQGVFCVMGVRDYIGGPFELDCLWREGNRPPVRVRFTEPWSPGMTYQDVLECARPR